MMTSPCDKTKRERQAILWPLITLMIMAILGLAFAHIAHSGALRVDAMICMVDVGVGLITLWVSHVSRKGPDPRYPIGRTGWVPLLNTAKGTLLLAICLNGLADAASALIDGAETVDFRLPALYSVIVLSLEFSNFLYVRRVARQIGSSLLQTEAKEWLGECVSSILIVVAFVTTYALQGTAYGALTDYVDPMLSVLLVGATLPLAISILRRNVSELLLQQADEEDVAVVRKAFDEVLPQFRQHRRHLTVLRIGDKLLVEIVLLLKDDEGFMTIQDVDRLRAQLLGRLRDLHDEIEAKLTLTRAHELFAPPPPMLRAAMA